MDYRLDVGVTGARIGDVVIGIQKCTTDAMIRIYEQEVFPLRKRLDYIRENGKAWKKFLQELNTISYFSKMTISEREIWLNEKQTDVEFLGDDVNGIQLQVLQTGDSDLNTRVEQEELDRLLNGKEESETGYWSNEEIEGFLPKKPGGGQLRKHTLFFLKWFWKIAVDHHKVDSFNGIIYDIENGSVLKECKEDDDHEIIVINDIASKFEKVKDTWRKTEGQDIAFIVPKQSISLDNETLNQLTLEICREIPSYCITRNCILYTDDINIENEKFIHTNQQIIEMIGKIRYSLRGYTSAAHKSLLQKLMRFGSPRVTLFNDNSNKSYYDVDAQIVLITCLCMLAQNPGSFVPDIQRFVTGLESLAKRIGVVAGFEDVYCHDQRDLLSLFAGSLLCQRVRSWRPSKSILKRWIITGCRAQLEDRACVYDHHAGWEMEPYTISHKLTHIQHCSALIEILRTYPGDIGMCRDIVKHSLAIGKFNRKTETYIKTVSRNREYIYWTTMPIFHGVDHHWSTGVAYFYTTKTIQKICGIKSDEDNSFLQLSTTSTFGLLFRELFRKVSGYNPRRHPEFDPELFYDDEFVLETYKAQRLYMIAKQNIQLARPVLKSSYVINHTLDNSWLAGLVGAINVPGTPAALVTLRSDDITQLVAIRRPSRNMDENISPQREEQAKVQARKMLREGIKLKGGKTLSEFLYDSTVYLNDNDEYIIKKGGITKTWEETRNLQIKVPYHPQKAESVEDALIFYGIGVEKNCWKSLSVVIECTLKEYVLRALSYLSTYKSEFEMYRISRDGNGTNYAVSINDVGAFHFLLRVSQIFPCALRAVQGCPQKFSVPIAPMLWKVVEYIRSETTTVKNGNWSTMIDKLGREPWEHQTDSVDEMVSNHKNHFKGNFMWIPVGLGKSMIVMKYLSYLQSKKELPEYVVYTLPASAIASVVHEIMAFGVKINYIIPLKSFKNKIVPKGITATNDVTLQPCVINMIEHDHMRRCSEELINKANQTFFIVDEVHKTLNETKRTSVALEISHLCHEFVVLTGTPIIDNKIYKLIGWLEQIVPFEVNEQNFWVSANSLVARKVTTGVKVHHKDITCQSEFQAEELKKYKKLVPFKMGGENTYPTIETFNDAAKVCYEVVTRCIVKQTLEWLEVKRGVMIVAHNKAHQIQLQSLLITRGVKSADIFLLTGNESLFLTDDAVAKKQIHDYKVVIVTIHKCEGYTLTRLSVLLTSVYPSNQANREQLEGRINRIGQKEKTIDIHTFHCGILTLILKHHNSAKSLSIALSDMVKTI